ncbi:hypothetical protein [Microbacterium sp. KR10-403]|uniref:hypothetical protein n=1 Tax=Microbacterium sp. KR10-403 TaxID=3158581 RepID=UPI0032E3F10E
MSMPQCGDAVVIYALALPFFIALGLVALIFKFSTFGGTRVRLVVGALALIGVVVATVGLVQTTTASAATVTGPATLLNVAPGKTIVKTLDNKARADGTAAVTYKLPAVPKSGTGVYASLRVRSANGAAYALQTRVYPTGKVQVTVKRVSNAGKTATALTGTRALTSSVKAGTPIALTLKVGGSTKVALTGTVKVGSSASQKISVTDSSTLRIRAKGKADFALYTSSSNPSTAVSLESSSTSGSTSASSNGTSSVAPGNQISGSSAGVPAGTVLTRHEGDIVITKPNTVISGLEVHGTITVKASGAVIKNSKIVGGKTPSHIGLINNVATGSSFSVIDSELVAAYPDSWWNGIYGSNFVVDGVNVHGVVDAVRVIGSNVTVRNSWLHGNLHYEADPLRNGTPSHDDSIQIQAGSNIVINGNRLEDAHNAAVQITQDTSKTALGSIQITNNFLQGGGCTVNIARTPTAVHPAVSGNTFGPERVFSGCAVIAPVANKPGLSGNTWSATQQSMATYTVLE